MNTVQLDMSYWIKKDCQPKIRRKTTNHPFSKLPTFVTSFRLGSVLLRVHGQVYWMATWGGWLSQPTNPTDVYRVEVLKFLSPKKHGDGHPTIYTRKLKKKIYIMDIWCIYIYHMKPEYFLLMSLSHNGNHGSLDPIISIWLVVSKFL